MGRIYSNHPPAPGFRQRIRRYPILIRLLIVNTIVIISGAVIGTVITRQITSLSVLELILVFSIIGILFSLGMNYWVFRLVLQPLHELRLAVDHFQVGDKAIVETGLMSADPDIHRLLVAINLMLSKLDNRTRLLSALSERAINAQEEERKRIARSLHDDTAQSISTLIIQLERIIKKIASANFLDEVLVEDLVKARRLAENILENLRENIWNLRPSILDDLGLSPAIRWLASTYLDEAGIQLDLNLPPENIRLPAHLETMLFRVTQEALNNVIRHSDAHCVTIRLVTDDTQIYLEIGDDGHGFDAATIQEQAISRKRLGLLGIQERTSLVGGTVQIESQPGTGTRLLITVPFLDKLLETNEDPGDRIVYELAGDVFTEEMPTRET